MGIIRRAGSLHYNTPPPSDTEKLCNIKVLPAVQTQLSVLEMTGPLMRLDWVKTSPDAVECQAFWKPPYDDPIFYRMAQHGGEVTWDVNTQEDHWFAQKCYSESCVHPIPKKGYGGLSKQPYFDALFGNVLFMPVLFEDKRRYMTVRSFKQLSPYSRIIGLLLWAEQGWGRGTYRRVGVAQLKAREARKALDLFRERVSTYQAGIREGDFCRTDEKGQYSPCGMKSCWLPLNPSNPEQWRFET